MNSKDCTSESVFMNVKAKFLLYPHLKKCHFMLLKLFGILPCLVIIAQTISYLAILAVFL